MAEPPPVALCTPFEQRRRERLGDPRLVARIVKLRDQLLARIAFRRNLHGDRRAGHAVHCRQRGSAQRHTHAGVQQRAVQRPCKRQAARHPGRLRGLPRSKVAPVEPAPCWRQTDARRNRSPIRAGSGRPAHWRGWPSPPGDSNRHSRRIPAWSPPEYPAPPAANAASR